MDIGQLQIEVFQNLVQKTMKSNEIPPNYIVCDTNTHT